MASRSNLIDVGRVAGAFGVKGWLKVRSYTEPSDNIFHYSPWWLKTRHGARPFEVEDYSVRGDGILTVHLSGIDDREGASDLNLASIAVEREQMPALSEGDYYWHQLIGLEVWNRYTGVAAKLGKVKTLMETGAHDVLVVAPSEDSLDSRERLVPYVPGRYVRSVDLTEGKIIVDWDPDFLR